MDLKLLENAPLFKDVAPDEIDAMLQCLDTEEKEYEKGEIIFHAGDVIHFIGLVLTGRVQIESDDLWGNRSVLESVEPGFAFAESYACLPGEPLMVSAIAAEPSRILFLDTGRVLTTCPSACSCRAPAPHRQRNDHASQVIVYICNKQHGPHTQWLLNNICGTLGCYDLKAGSIIESHIENSPCPSSHLQAATQR